MYPTMDSTYDSPPSLGVVLLFSSWPPDYTTGNENVRRKQQNYTNRTNLFSHVYYIHALGVCRESLKVSVLSEVL